MSSGGRSSSRSCARTTAIGRPTRPATCSLPSAANVSTRPQRRVDRAQQRRERRLAVGAGLERRTRARRGVGGHEAGGETPERLLRRREAEERAGVGRALAAGGDLPHHAAAHRLVQEFADRRAVDAEHLEALVEVVGQHEAGDRVHLERRLDLIDARLGAFGADRRRRVDEAELPARRAQQARRHRQRAGLVRQRRPRRRDDAWRPARRASVRTRRASRARVSVMQPASSDAGRADRRGIGDGRAVARAAAVRR